MVLRKSSDLEEWCQQEGCGRDAVECEARHQVPAADLPRIPNLVTGGGVGVGGQEADHDVYYEDDIDDNIRSVQQQEAVKVRVDFWE